MKVIEPSYEWIEDELEKLPLDQRIEKCGRLCYKSEDKITEESAPAFVRKVRDSGHNSVLEMAVVTLGVEALQAEDVENILPVFPKFLHITEDDNGLLITGSIRAFREQLLSYPRRVLPCDMADFAGHLKDKVGDPIFWEDILSMTDLPPIDDRALVADIVNPETLPHPHRMKHQYVAIKFTVNRAVSHELVRHRPCSFLQESQRYCRYDGERFGSEVTFIQPYWAESGGSSLLTWLEAMHQAEQHYFTLLNEDGCTPQAARTVLPNSCKTEIIVYCNLQEWHHILRLRTANGADPSMREVMIPLLADLQERFPGMFDDITPAG